MKLIKFLTRLKANFMDHLSSYSITMSFKPWELMRKFWGEGGRVNRLARMCSVGINSAYRFMQEFGDWGSGRKSDLHRFCDQVEWAVSDASDEELTAVRELAELPLRVYQAARVARCADAEQGTKTQCSDEKLYLELSDVIHTRLAQKSWAEQRREIAEAIELLRDEIAAGDERETRTSGYIRRAS